MGDELKPKFNINKLNKNDVMTIIIIKEKTNEKFIR
jgi:hypothetical protein